MAQPRAQLGLAVSAPVARGRGWILGAWQDLLLFVATPLLILPAVLLAQQRVSAEQIALLVAAFGATGHHLPGLMRAYGDRELFARFRARFVAAPVLLLAVCVPFSLYELEGLQVVVLLWGIWHGLAQVYGFARIYDVKVRSTAALTGRLDLALCATWFGAGVLHSPERMASLVRTFYKAGGPLLSPAALELFTAAWTALTAVVTVLFAANLAMRFARGEPQSPAKLLLLAASIGFWWYTLVAFEEIVVGVALFELFHDVQYLAIVWIYNRKRVESGPGVRAFTRFVFRRRAWLLLVYVGLVLAYGSLGMLPDAIGNEGVEKALLGVLAASALLHFYYDGFIWKVRERSTREGLGLQGGAEGAAAPAALPAWVAHGAKWSLFAVPVALLTLTQLGGTAPLLEQYQNLAALVPGSASSHYNLGVSYERAGRLPEAARHLERAIAIAPDEVLARNNLAWLLSASSDADLRDSAEAVRLAESAVRASGGTDPQVLDTLAVAYASAGRFPEAIAIARDAVAAARAGGAEPLADEIAARLALYERGTPYRD